ncbi:probable galactinol--sucrose galactosyltransferase 5 [Rhodamnia argentea]|uniref:galactinol--sucrose galactosyltransferase n=1 Tax=Rhodamnia argentea TaxID=178133 RepID=A0A8B8QCE6_9MYRT|nr:probable galactinol--sucrose galactosyltransferase 5 [Rhodamnia argentea]XP_048128517.1 probable galactinol--sucrose galactosyltransferase 5 [Rhodamnia argentea]
MAPSLSTAGSDVTSLVDGCAGSVINLEDSNFLVNGHVILSEVPPDVTASPSAYHASGEKAVATVPPGCFVGFDAAKARSRHVTSIGKLRGIRFMSIFRFKVWWTTHWVGTNGRDLEQETQMVILDRSDEESETGQARPYVLLLPLLEGPFRASIQPGPDDFVDLCLESGSTKVTAAGFRSALYMHAGDDPFALVKDAIKVAKDHLGTFKLLEEKTPPGIVDKFGWCTWDAFYLTVHPEGIWDGVKGLVEGGCPPGLVLIDDGWQSISHDEDPVTKEGMNHAVAGEQMPCRLLKFQENHKFRDYVSPRGKANGARGKGMGAFVRDLKEEFGSVDYVYVWHALCGYWGGLRPGAPGLPESSVVKPKLSPGLETRMEDLAVDKIVNNGVGLVPPELVERMYEGLHSHLESVGIDGVKVDVIHLLEMLCEKYGGRVELAKAYYKALTASVRKHFKGNGVIASMEHCNDFMFLGTEAISLGRVGDDFWCTDPSGDPNGTFWLQGCHMVHCAYNSLWMGNFIQPDWDMFQSTHPCALFHAASRAISGGPIYISDKVGQHDFELLRRLVLPDGSILRCEHYALPTRDCIFVDPLHDGKTMLKIWNLNKFTGVIGAFNCQGGGWCRESRRNKCASQFSHAVACTTNPTDIEWGAGGSRISVDGVRVFALYLSQSKRLVLSKPSESLEISLEPFQFELVTVSPVRELRSAAGARPVQFAPVGLMNMLNGGGAIHGVEHGKGWAEVAVRGGGELRAFASERPRECRVDGRRVGFEYEGQMVVIQVAWPGSSGMASVVEYLF